MGWEVEGALLVSSGVIALDQNYWIQSDFLDRSQSKGPGVVTATNGIYDLSAILGSVVVTLSQSGLWPR